MMAEDLVCEDCGRTGDGVDETFEPVSMELYGEELPMTLCGGCFFERAQDV